jgi:prevent-host-death family protein
MVARRIWSTKLVDLDPAVVAMRQVNMHEAKTHLSRLVEEAAAGEAFVICKAGRPMVRVTALDDASHAAPERRRLGLLRGQCELPDDFDRMAAGTIADLFEGSWQGG